MSLMHSKSDEGEYNFSWELFKIYLNKFRKKTLDHKS